MKIAHIVRVTPHRAGLYETARELAEGLRDLGHHAFMIDPVQNYLSITNMLLDPIDRNVPIHEPALAEEADLLINHSGLSGELNQLDKPIIHMLHGRPYSSFILEQTGKIAIYSYWRKVAGDPRFKAFVTFWPSFVPYFQNILPPEKVHAIPAPVDLEAWTPEGPDGYQFHGNSGNPNVVCTDLWREDIDPYHIINAFMYFADRLSGAKLHIYAAPQKGTAWGILKATLREKGYLGECVGIVKGLDNVYRAADVMITPHCIATRSIREALACGCQVVSGPSGKYTPYQAHPEDLKYYAGMINQAYNDLGKTHPDTVHLNRSVAEEHFDPENTADQFNAIIKEVMNNG